jgi:hypothetical protein
MAWSRMTREPLGPGAISADSIASWAVRRTSCARSVLQTVEATPGQSSTLAPVTEISRCGSHLDCLEYGLPA